MGYTLGIDIGTSSVKCSVVSPKEKQLISSTKCDTLATVKNLTENGHDEQDVSKIIQCIKQCLTNLSKENGKISSIVICGQMHGVVLWNSTTLKPTLKPDDGVSNLITWRDARCDANFLNSLPKSTQLTQLSSGFGCASILWLKQHRPGFLDHFNSAGTIADYIVVKLTMCKPIMCYQNAFSWGYYNHASCDWDISMIKKVDFPMHLLPGVVPDGTQAGTLHNNCCGIPAGTRVNVALGDMQCSVMACQPTSKEIVLNVSTSAQISAVVDRKKMQNTKPDRAAVDLRETAVSRVPYFDGCDLLTFASLNGGPVLGEYVRMLTEWTRRLVPGITTDQVYLSLMESSPKPCSKLRFEPAMFGERHDPETRASLHNIDSSNFNPPEMARAIAAGVLSNLRTVFEASGLDEAKDIRHVWACGGTFTKNRLFREELTHNVFYDKTVSFERKSDADFGAALSVMSET